jgi:hypothetical protein
MHTENNQVFYFNPLTEDFSLFYDFNAEIGKSWEVEDWGNNYNDTSYTVNVFDTDTVEYNGIALKRMMVYYGDSTQFIKFDTIVEKFGSLEKMFWFENPVCDDSRDVGLRCYQDDEIGLFSFVSFACDAIPTVEIENLEELIIEIYPTLFNNYISIELEQSSLCKIFSLTGEDHFQKNISEGKNEVNLSHLKNGIYFIQLFDNKGHPLIVKKLVKIE